MGDEVCRADKWGRVYDQYEEENPACNATVFPWDAVILNTAWGTVMGPLAHLVEDAPLETLEFLGFPPL